MEQSFSHNQPNAIITRLTEFESLNQNGENGNTLNDFDFIYLDSHKGVNLQITFEDTFEVPSTAVGTEQINSVGEWDISQLNPEEATGDCFGYSCKCSRLCYI